MVTNLGQILTFYSYKGGTGRSMALANVACLLAQRQDVNKDVLMIDWDLEAPGLHQFFHGKFDNQREGKNDLPSEQLGLIDLFYEITTRLMGKDARDDNFEDIFTEINIDKYIIKVNQLSLYLMPAGRFDDGLYSTRVNEFNWVDFFVRFPSLISQFADFLRKKYKYILIDSRTGYTDTSGICTSIMPEKLVTVFTPNRQSLSGVVELIRKAVAYRKQSDDLRPLMVFPLPSRIENAENKLQTEWRFGDLSQSIVGYQTQIELVLKEVYEIDNCDLTKYFDEYQLQYIPRYSYGEEIAVLSERSEDRLSLARSFESFTKKIISNDNPWETVLDLHSISEPVGAMAANDPLYIERVSDQEAMSTLNDIEGFTITIKGTRQTGKSSLLNRLLVAAGEKNMRTAYIDFQLIENSSLENSEVFFRYFCRLLSWEFELEDRTERFWKNPLGAVQKTSTYMQRYILNEISQVQILLVMDEVERMFASSFRSDFFSMLRSWHNNRARGGDWKRFNLALSTSTEPYQFIADLNQSPFNVGNVIELQDFTLDEVSDLDNRYQQPLTLAQVQQLFNLLSGHPYLTRRALHLIASQRTTITELFDNASEDNGPFGDHLRNCLFGMANQENLKLGLLQVIKNNRISDDQIYFRLRGAGLVKRVGNLVVPRNKLYAEYFSKHLN
jgi:MinD-like ATPase involved in chromosome partitioning or flagellar assembly